MAQTMATAVIPGLQPNEAGLLLDGSIYVAASVIIKRDPVNSTVTAIATARAVKQDGTPLLDAHDQPIVSTHPRSCDAASFSGLGATQLSADALKLAIGDTNDATLGVADDNIRAAIAVAAVSGPVSATAALGL